MALAETAETRPAAVDFLLPPMAYTDPGWLAAERARLFDASWALVADAAAVAEVGSRVAVRAGRCPLVVIRTAAGSGGLRAFHNVCRHRGMTIVQSDERDESPPCDASLRCPYHGWEWDLDGTLVRVPQRRAQFPDLDPGTLGLHPAAVGEWRGMVFANPDPTADGGDLDHALAGLDDHLGSFRPELLPQIAHVRIDVACNWKLFVENHIDVYHLWYLHDASLGAFDHTRFEHHAPGRNWASYEPLRAPAEAPPDDAIRHLDERDRRGIQAHMLFPNTLMAASSAFFTTYAIHPVSPERSWIDLRVRAEPDADVEAVTASIRAFIDEDVSACEQVQVAVGGPRFGVGPLARTHERPITTFHTHLLAALDRRPR
jgi:phenylpropionate dioxygenase-like ring-hydroxylating dioxygenase large terminal subunit